MGGDGWERCVRGCKRYLNCVVEGREEGLSRRPWVLAVARCRSVPGCRLLVLGLGPREPCQKRRLREFGGWGARLKQDVSESRLDMSLVTLAPRGIFRVPYWAPFDASVPNGVAKLCAPEFRLVGARMRAPMQRGLGVSTFSETRDGRTHPGATGVGEQASDDLSELYKASRGTF
ncbi:hypothetical protein CRG98_014077 [Punica granatum]|uniref:Uncharacterized protein n=1 Tax=Punica granatum TaxID=22663 RepID=A0A2I0KAL3_PUNGR|nr:hypothetical protein CRG98_014077 [Punica granatum]